MEQLTAERFAGGEVTVGFYPHCTLDFPVAGLYHLLHVLKQLGLLFLDELELLGLRGDELVFGEFLHHIHRSGEGALALFLGLTEGPKPSGVDVGVTDADNVCHLLAALLFIELGADVVQRSLYAGVVLVGASLTEIDEVDGLVECGADLAVLLALKRQEAHYVIGNLQVIVKRSGILVDELKIYVQIQICRSAGEAVNGEFEGFYGRVDGEGLVVAVHALHNLAVHIDDVLGISKTGRVYHQFHVFSLLLLFDSYRYRISRNLLLE